jgi:hypothetical protein
MLKSAIKRVAFSYLEGRGYNMRGLKTYQMQSVRSFYAAEQVAKRRYEAFSAQFKIELPAILEAKYAEKPIVGKVRVYDLIARLAAVINPLEPELGCVSQLTHELQLAGAMEQDGRDEKLVLCALLHDLGTILLATTDEDPMYVEAGGMKAPLSGSAGGGLYGCSFRWDHGDFIYLRLKDYVSPDVAWLLRHHSMDLDDCEPFMNEQDREYSDRLFVPFRYYDERKDMFNLPNKRLEDYRPLIDRTFPNEILF